MRNRPLLAAFCLTLALTALATPVLGSGLFPSAEEPSLFSRFILWIFDQQRQFHRELTQDLRLFKAEESLGAAAGLIAVSFLYGLLHAAGPGHGKAILTTYLLTHRERVGRGVRLAAIASACQGLTAIVIVYGVTWLAGLAPRDTSTTTLWSERASYTLVLIVGGMLGWRAIRALRRHLRQSSATGGMQLGRLSNLSGTAIPAMGAMPQMPSGAAVHPSDCGCGHCHTLTVAEIDRAKNFRTALALILSIGLRPCTGAILVLVFASILNLPFIGIAAVVAMSGGTALAVAGLALLAVNARRFAARLSLHRHPRLAYTGDIATLLGSLLLIAIGASLLSTSFGAAHPLGMF